MPKSRSPPRKSTSPIQMTSSSPPGTKSPPASSTSHSTTKRLLRELSDLSQSPQAAVLHLGPVSESNLFAWEGVLRGPRNSPYSSGLWLLSISIPPTYPLHPPTITFGTPICHPNISFSTGEICLTLLTAEHWTPAYTIAATIEAIQQLLLEPVVESPLNVDVANLMREGDRVGAEALVRYWTGERRWAGEGQGGWIGEGVGDGTKGRGER